MAVHFAAASGRAATPANVMPQLHTVLLGAGWELVWADADAIGTGTAASPKWDKALAANNVSVGTAVYRMPAVAGFPTRWTFSINARSEATTSWGLYVTIGTDASAATGAQTNPGAQQKLQGGSAGGNTTSTEWYTVAYEHGFVVAVHLPANGWLYASERRRRLDGTILDDLNTYLCNTISTNTFASIGGMGYGRGGAQSRSIVGGEYAPQLWAVLAAVDGTVPYTLNRMDGATGIPQGPFGLSNGTSGLPRLFVFLPSNDVTVGVDSTLAVDGANHAYHITTSGGVIHAATASIGRIGYARD